jgi:hypothetical protein
MASKTLPNLKSVTRELDRVAKELRRLKGRVGRSGSRILDLKLRQLRGFRKQIAAACPRGWGVWPEELAARPRRRAR